MHSRLLTLAVAATLVLNAGCSGKKKPEINPPASAQAPTPGPAASRPRFSLRQQIIKVAQQEWEFFGKQTVRLEGSEESIPHVGKWEDDGDPWSSRVNWYWNAVGKPGLDGYDCKEPWSAAFISWVMRQAGLNESQFPPSDAHWHYIRYFVERSGYSGSPFVSHRIGEYSPKPGDLICATRGNSGFIPVYEGSPSSVLMGHTKLHCDIVVERQGAMLGTIGGNVRNSVSKTFFPLDGNGLLRPSERRPWFVVLENRLSP